MTIREIRRQVERAKLDYRVAEKSTKDKLAEVKRAYKVDNFGDIKKKIRSLEKEKERLITKKGLLHQKALNRLERINEAENDAQE